jgi:hypothetical protein
VNTTHTRVVVSLLLSVATLATVGFRAPHEDSRTASILPDHAVCQLNDLSLSAIELLELVDAHCDPALVDQVESEIDKGSAGAGSIEAWLDGFYASIRPSAGGVEYLESVESETDSFASPSVSFSARSRATNTSYINPADVAAIVQQKGYIHPSDIVSLLASRNGRYRSTGLSARSASGDASYINPADVAAIVQQKGYVHPSDIVSLLANGG